MIEGKDHTIEEELASREIQTSYFNKFYNKLNKEKKLPPDLYVPLKQYGKIVDYLKDNLILRAIDHEGIFKYEIDNKALDLFNHRRTLEALIIDYDKSKRKRKHSERELPEFPPLGRSSGGLMPCREHDHFRTTGGLMPCRDEDTFD